MIGWLEQRRSGKLPTLGLSQNVQTHGSCIVAEQIGKQSPEMEFQLLRTLYNYPKPSTVECALIPISLDVDADGMRLIDSFLWNV